MIDLAVVSAQTDALLARHDLATWSSCVRVELWHHRYDDGGERRESSLRIAVISPSHQCLSAEGGQVARVLEDLDRVLADHVAPPAALDDLRVELPTPVTAAAE